VAIISILIFCSVYLYCRHKDALLTRFLSSEQQFSAAEVFKMLDRIKTPHGVRFFIESALQIDLMAYPEMTRILSDIAAAAEVAEAKRKTEGWEKKREAIVVPGVTPEFAD
jgi:hypothetical protein